MPNAPLKRDDFERMIINPLYTTAIHPDLFVDVLEPLVKREQWIGANAQLIRELGPEAWLERLLEVLGGAFPRSDE